MRIPVRTLQLKELDAEYGDYFVKVQRSVKERVIRRLLEWSSDNKEDPQVQTAANVEFLSLVQEWNLDDDNGQTLPLIRDLPDAEECRPKEGRHAADCPKLEVLGELPAEVIKFVIEKTSGQSDQVVPEKTADF